MYKLINLENHAIVEVVDFPLPKIDLDQLVLVDQKHVCNTPDAKRLSASYGNQYGEYIKQIFLDKVLPLLKEHPLYQGTVLSTLTPELIGVGVVICKDQVGWHQSIHVDHPVAHVSGVIHLTDCENSTTFYDSPKGTNIVYEAPVKVNSGAFWLNVPSGYHSIGPVTLERNHCLILIKTNTKFK